MLATKVSAQMYAEGLAEIATFLGFYGWLHMTLFSAGEASYNGGGNIVFNGRLDGDVNFTARLFKPLLHLSSSPITVSYSVSPSTFRYITLFDLLVSLLTEDLGFGAGEIR
ncbi:unnamed protein product [Brassica rapa]|uniref:Uncharacterized protein n=1 Tax=Brassica campestris TaxID=3711 RepID=A0A3P5ZYG3_BRACM|nr:unnamed protein product [Brassica rapa]VDC77700.1 unnamed protein product [Brassica rapa]